MPAALQTSLGSHGGGSFDIHEETSKFPEPEGFLVPGEPLMGRRIHPRQEGPEMYWKHVLLYDTIHGQPVEAPCASWRGGLVTPPPSLSR